MLLQMFRDPFIYISSLVMYSQFGKCELTRSPFIFSSSGYGKLAVRVVCSPLNGGNGGDVDNVTAR